MSWQKNFPKNKPSSAAPPSAAAPPKNSRARHRRIFKHFLRIRAGGPPALEGRARARARALSTRKIFFLSSGHDPF